VFGFGVQGARDQPPIVTAMPFRQEGVTRHEPQTQTRKQPGDKVTPQRDLQKQRGNRCLSSITHPVNHACTTSCRSGRQTNRKTTQTNECVACSLLPSTSVRAMGTVYLLGVSGGPGGDTPRHRTRTRTYTQAWMGRPGDEGSAEPGLADKTSPNPTSIPRRKSDPPALPRDN
jgi:hypothetical protein